MLRIKIIPLLWNLLESLAMYVLSMGPSFPLYYNLTYRLKQGIDEFRKCVQPNVEIHNQGELADTQSDFMSNQSKILSRFI